MSLPLPRCHRRALNIRPRLDQVFQSVPYHCPGDTYGPAIPQLAAEVEAEIARCLLSLHLLGFIDPRQTSKTLLQLNVYAREAFVSRLCQWKQSKTKHLSKADREDAVHVAEGIPQNLEFWVHHIIFLIGQIWDNHYMPTHPRSQKPQIPRVLLSPEQVSFNVNLGVWESLMQMKKMMGQWNAEYIRQRQDYENHVVHNPAVYWRDINLLSDVVIGQQVATEVGTSEMVDWGVYGINRALTRGPGGEAPFPHVDPRDLSLN